jgi:hypothetical protein
MTRGATLLLALLGIFALPGAATVTAAEVDPTIAAFQLPEQIKWSQNPSNPGVQQAVLYGDPTKPGLYIVLVKWLPGHMSRPHFHPNDRFITVISGTWWVGTGPKYDPDSTVPMPAGTFVTHYGKKVHYDGAKEGETVLQIVGEGPATSSPFEQPR